jgi:splicing factor 3B subunit 3
LNLGSNRDYVVVGSDSGKISIIEFDVELNDWKQVHCEVFGKSGCRRIVPGQYLAADPKGRALMIGETIIHQLFWLTSILGYG